ncbi:MAG: hypothetical protein IPI06_13990 [Gammaproteobacteria bacterium]|nr:hypothetical protein [Gammaproteobacteria bacterium]
MAYVRESIRSAGFPDAVAPWQFALAVAVLVRALADVAVLRAGERAYDASLDDGRDALRWIAGEDLGGLRFEQVAESLGLGCEALRASCARYVAGPSGEQLQTASAAALFRA